MSVQARGRGSWHLPRSFGRVQAVEEGNPIGEVDTWKQAAPLRQDFEPKHAFLARRGLEVPPQRVLNDARERTPLHGSTSLRPPDQAAVKVEDYAHREIVITHPCVRKVPAPAPG